MNKGMIKKFFISMLGTIAGFWISLLILGLVGFGIIVGLVASASGSDVAVKKNSVLYIELSGLIPDRYQPADPLTIMRQQGDMSDALVDIVQAVRSAASDDRILGIYIDAAGSQIGKAAAEELVDALRDFKQSGKWVLAYGDNYEQTDYLVATQADAVYLNPVGAVNIHGLTTEVPFMKGLFDKLNIKMQVVRVGTYKSAVEPYILTEMSEPARLQMQVLLDTIWNYEKGAIAEARSLKAADVDNWADSMILCRPVKYMIDNGAVDSLLYRRQVEDILRERCDIDDDEDLPLITPTDYVSTMTPSSADNHHIAVLFASGDIVDSGEGGIVGDQMPSEIIALADDDNVKALVMRVNSPGGSAFASEQIWEALGYFKSKGKPFYVSMGNYAASGGYYISCGADKIYANRSTLTGSIGVFGVVPDLSGLMNNHLGITFSTVSTNPNAFGLSTNRAMTKAEFDAMQTHVEVVYDLFTKRVAEGRHISQDSVKVIGSGRVWSGADGLRIGLVDKIGTLSDAINDIAQQINIEPEKVVYYPAVEENFMQIIARHASQNMQVGGNRIDAETLKLIQFINYVRTMAPIQARMQSLEIR